jgi:hypothetical protein
MSMTTSSATVRLKSLLYETNDSSSTDDADTPTISNSGAAPERLIQNADEESLRNVKSRALFVLRAIKDGKRSSDSELMDELAIRMRQTPELDPLNSEDTYGVQAMFNYLAKNNKNVARRAKRFYKSLLDRWIMSQTSTKSGDE